jgi:phosphate transport system permease protein
MSDTTGPLTLDSLRGDPRRMRTELATRVLVLAAAVTSILISALIIFSLAGEAWTYVSQVELGALWTDGWFPRRGLYDVKTIVVGSILVTAVAMLLAVPLGLGAAVYLSEYAPKQVRKVLKPAVEILAGIPSVVLGFFALTWISPEIVQRFVDGSTQFNLAAAGITTDVFGPGQTMTAAMASQAAGTDQVRGAGLTFQSLFFVGMLLFLVTLALNLVADRFVRRVRQRY